MANSGRSGTDFYLHDLWRTIGRRPGRTIHLQVAAILSLLIGLPLCVPALFEPHPLNALLVLGIASVVLVSWSILGIRQWIAKSSPLTRVEFKALSTWRGLGRTVATFCGGFAFPVVLLAVFRWMNRDAPDPVKGASLGASIAFGVLAGTALAVTELSVTRDWVSVPSEAFGQPIRKSIRRGVIIGLAVALLFCILTLVYHTRGPLEAVFLGLLSSVIIAAFVGLIVFLLSVARPWLIYYALAVLYLARRKQFPLRPARFLDWAYDAGLVRLSGTATQFRHRELQVYFTTIGER
ncbi:hypothetical protein [Kribbella sp. NPDC006257]|uniref:hypothetical protein n=1 Tax=Kribbella sp. NPDC006257 TaxID=3156738 RepID=UPI0033B01A85